ncbi:hypothetical protein Adu01nite_05130 [Paractinoplanes durhamensis]|uniref:Uncharacterized protein n=1 Tax=Paractinoplanes durhamensis TaxID=113563 RepID=A0ABQ3YNK9_9ACTN|nr:hypothetical protein Adu01nite_05130 [Actinoplanes durhamensis]
MLGSDLVGLPTPDAGPLFATALSVHIASGLATASRDGPASTSTMDLPCLSGTSYPTSPIGCCPALSAYPSSGSRCVAFRATRAPTRPATDPAADPDQPRVDRPTEGGGEEKDRVVRVTVW